MYEYIGCFRKVFVLILLFSVNCVTVFSQSDRAHKYWENLPDAKINFYNNDGFWGILLDGNKMAPEHQYSFFMSVKNRLNICIDANVFKVDADTSIVWDFEKLLKDTIEKNKELLLIPPDMALCDYIRQYVRFSSNDMDFLYVGFHVPDYDTKNRKYVRALSEYRFLIYSKSFVSEHHRWVLYDNQFFVLYEIGKKELKFVYFETKRDLPVQTPQNSTD